MKHEDRPLPTPMWMQVGIELALRGIAPLILIGVAMAITSLVPRQPQPTTIQRSK